MNNRTTPGQMTLDHLDEIGQAFNRQDVAAIANYFREDGVFLFPVGPDPWGLKLTGRKEIRDALAKRFALISDMRWDVIDRWLNGNRGVSEFVVSGTTSSGERLHHYGCDLWLFQDGQIVKKDTYWKRVVKE